MRMIARMLARTIQVQTIRVAAAGTFLLVLVCCSGPQAGTDNETPREVENTGQEDWPNQAAWYLREDLRLGGKDKEGPQQFSVITAVISDTSGMIYVLDLLAQEVRVFDPTGRFLHRLGKKGPGPGELSDAKDIALGPGDTIWILDSGTHRYSAFDRNGQFLTSHPRTIRRYAGPARFMSDGTYVDWSISFPDERPGVVAGERIALQPVRLSAGFQVRDTMPPIVYTREMLKDGARPQPFFARTVVAQLTPDGSVWFAHSNEYRLFRRTLEGDTVLTFSLPVTPASVGDAERKYVQSLRMQPSLARDYIDALPQTKPIINAIADDGVQYVYVFPEIAGAVGVAFVDAFHHDGRYIGRMRLPHEINVLDRQPVVVHAAQDYLLVVFLDDYDVPYVSRLRIIRP